MQIKMFDVQNNLFFLIKFLKKKLIYEIKYILKTELFLVLVCWCIYKNASIELFQNTKISILKVLRELN